MWFEIGYLVRLKWVVKKGLLTPRSMVKEFDVRWQLGASYHWYSCAFWLLLFTPPVPHYLLLGVFITGYPKLRVVIFSAYDPTQDNRVPGYPRLGQRVPVFFYYKKSHTYFSLTPINITLYYIKIKNIQQKIPTLSNEHNYTSTIITPFSNTFTKQ